MLFSEVKTHKACVNNYTNDKVFQKPNQILIFSLTLFPLSFRIKLELGFLLLSKFSLISLHFALAKVLRRSIPRPGLMLASMGK